MKDDSGSPTRPPKRVEISRHLKTLNERQGYLSQQIRDNRCSDAKLGYMCAEWNAIHWAISVLEVLRMAGGFNEEEEQDG